MSPDRSRAVAGATLILAAVVAAVMWQRAHPAPVAVVPVASGLLDLKGRPVRVQGTRRRLAIDDSRYLVALGLVHPDPVSLLAAWPHDVNRLGAETYAQLRRKSPGLDSLPKVASSAGAFDVESLLAAAPDVALLSLGSGVTDAQVARIEGAGIPVVVLDFFVQPLQNLEPSLLLLGALVGREPQARAFVTFRKAHLDHIAEWARQVPEGDRPTVFLEPHAGMGGDCCNSPGRGNVGEYLRFVGGHNIGAEVISQAFGKLNLEFIVSRDPDVYIGTGGPHLEKVGGLVLGPGFDETRAHASLVKVTSRKGISGLSAVKERRAHGISHQLLNSPLDVVAIEAFARWLYPDTFQALEPSKTLAEINQRFLAVPYEGVYWVDL